MLLLTFKCFVFMLMYGNPLFSKCSVAGGMGDHRYNAYFVDLFVRASNRPAITMYEKLGYVVYRRVLKYYSGEEDGLGESNFWSSIEE
jgi:hypothetical protein